jgi:predicted RNase H-like HicB family nuclease
MADWKKAAQLFNFARAAETREKAFIALKEATQKQLPERGLSDQTLRHPVRMPPLH